MASSANLRLKEGKVLPIMESFFSIQGEGFHSGRAAYFLRIGGCDVGCHWCDVKDSWDANNHPIVEVNDIIEELCGTSIDTVVITGGEPLMWNLNYLCEKLKELGFSTNAEKMLASGIFQEPIANEPALQTMFEEVKAGL